MERNNNTNILAEAFKSGEPEQIASAMNQRFAEIASGMIEEHETASDRQILTARGVRQLTSEERGYYNALAEAMKDGNPRQAIANLDKTIPVSVIERVFEDMRESSPLIDAIDLIPSGGAARMIIDNGGYDMAAWGDLCDDITKEMSASVKVVDTMLYKLSAFVVVCNEALELGAEWLDRYVRACLTEYFVAGLEYAVVTGTGKSMPIGMDRDVSENVTVTAGVYPQKTAVVVTALDEVTLGNIAGMVAVSENGKPRAVRDLILVCNTADYYSKVFAATHIMAPDGSYRQATPFPMTIVHTPQMPIGEAVIGEARLYKLAGGIGKNGRIEYSDEAKFIEDKRAYRIKGYFYGRANDNTSFIRLDISGVKAMTYKVTTINGTPSNVATLAALNIGNLTLSPTFSASTTSYTASTTNASDVVTALPTNGAETLEVKLGTAKKANGSAITWATGSNTLTVKATAEDGTTTKTYTVTVTKS